jgi:hypothetical protein
LDRSREQKAESKKQKAIVADGIEADFIQHRILLIPLIILIFILLIIKGLR